MRIIETIAALLALRFVLNWYRFWRVTRFLNRYGAWINGKEPNLVEYRAEVVTLLKHAGIKDSHVANVQLAGYGMVSTSHVSVFDNFPNGRQDMGTITIRMFLIARGVYRERMWSTFNPLAWLDGGVNMPRIVLGYLGVSAESLATKILQILWWALTVTVGGLYAFFRPQLLLYSKTILLKLIK